MKEFVNNVIVFIEIKEPNKALDLRYIIVGSTNASKQI